MMATQARLISTANRYKVGDAFNIAFEKALKDIKEIIEVEATKGKTSTTVSLHRLSDVRLREKLESTFKLYGYEVELLLLSLKLSW